MAFNVKGARRPSGSYTALTVEGMLLLVGVLFLTVAQKLSLAVSQYRPRALSFGDFSLSKSKFFSCLALSSSGMVASTARLLVTHLVSLKPPREQISLKFFTRSIVCFSVATGLRQSST